MPTRNDWPSRSWTWTRTRNVDIKECELYRKGIWKSRKSDSDIAPNWNHVKKKRNKNTWINSDLKVKNCTKKWKNMIPRWKWNWTEKSCADLFLGWGTESGRDCSVWGVHSSQSYDFLYSWLPSLLSHEQDVTYHALLAKHVIKNLFFLYLQDTARAPQGTSTDTDVTPFPFSLFRRNQIPSSRAITFTNHILILTQN